MSIAANLIARTANVTAGRQPGDGQPSGGVEDGGVDRDECESRCAEEPGQGIGLDQARDRNADRSKSRHRFGTRARSASVAAATATPGPSNTPPRRPPGSGCGCPWGPVGLQISVIGNGAQSEYHQRHHTARRPLNSTGGEKSCQPVVVIKAPPPSMRRVHRRSIWPGVCLRGNPGNCRVRGINAEYQFSKRATTEVARIGRDSHPMIIGTTTADSLPYSRTRSAMRR